MSFKFLKTGAASAQMAKQNAAEQEQRRESQGKLFRFWLKKGEEARITFVDGDLSPEGFLLPPRYYEHGLYLNGSWNNFFVCPEKTNPDAHDKCPICESADRPSLVAVFTIIDHRTFTSNKGKTYKDTKKLFVAKPQTYEILNKIAMKRGGLSGLTFDVSRMGEKDPGVGALFDFVEKKTIDELKPLYMVERTDPKTNEKKKVSNFTPADYETEIVYRTGDALRKLGLGKEAVEAGVQSTATSGEQPDYSEQL